MVNEWTVSRGGEDGGENEGVEGRGERRGSRGEGEGREHRSLALCCTLIGWQKEEIDLQHLAVM